MVHTHPYANFLCKNGFVPETNSVPKMKKEKQKLFLYISVIMILGCSAGMPSIYMKIAKHESAHERKKPSAFAEGFRDPVRINPLAF